MFTAANSIVPALFNAITIMRDCCADTVPRVDPLDITKFAGVPDTVVTVPLPNVVERKSNVNADAEMVKAFAETDAEIGCICTLLEGVDQVGAAAVPADVNTCPLVPKDGDEPTPNA